MAGGGAAGGPDARGGGAPWGAAVLAAVVVALGIHGLWFEATLPHRLPSERDWREAAAVVEREARPGDAVALAPWWAERGRLFLPERVPVLALPGYAGEALPGVRRVFLVELPRAPRWNGREARELRARADAAGPGRSFGALRLTLLTLRAPLLPRAFLPDLLDGAEVTLGGRPCPAEEVTHARAGVETGAPRPEGSTARAFRCPGPPWLRAAAETREVELRPRDCIYAHPAAGAPLHIRFPAVPLGTTLRGHTGIIGEAALGGAAPVRLSVAADGAYLGAVEEPPRTPGWHPFAFDTRRLAGRTAEVAFTVTSPDPSSRWFCFDAMTVDEPLGAPESPVTAPPLPSPRERGGSTLGSSSVRPRSSPVRSLRRASSPLPQSGGGMGLGATRTRRTSFPLPQSGPAATLPPLSRSGGGAGRG